mmetsp:Transcript_30026/g.54719  ORF Transcript_30026/g.54719 Transcript_30026/m.54719 type:complete len:151 (+) Transcript_30026:70-522(+)
MAEELAELNRRLLAKHEARGWHGGLGRVKSGSAPLGPVSNKPKKEPAGEDPLYRRFERGPVLGGAQPPEETGRDPSAEWVELIDLALKEAGGTMPWDELRDEVVRRWSESHAKDKVNEKALQLHAVANIPKAYLNADDEFVRLPKRKKVA